MVSISWNDALIARYQSLRVNGLFLKNVSGSLYKKKQRKKKEKKRKG
jgi:hypothetical protein